MTKYFVFSLFLTCSLALFSQTSIDESVFRVSLNDLKLTTYAKDSSANALVLYEHGKSFVDPTFYNLRTDEQHKIKILNKEGFKYANITIPLYIKDGNTYERVENIIATTYNLVDNEVTTTKLEKEQIFKEKFDEHHTLVKFTLPNVKEGSVITYSYTKVTPFMFNYRGWDFQSEIPKLYSEYNASIPANWTYNIKLVGGKKFALSETNVKKDCLTGGGGSANCFEARYVMTDMPSFIEEDYMTSKSNYLVRIEYELMSFQGFNGVKNDYTKTWKTVDDELKKDDKIGKQIGKLLDIETLLPSDILNDSDELHKAESIYNYVQEQYTWNEEYRIFQDTSVKNLIKNKSGNVSSINILLHNLLQLAGIEVKPVLLSTRNNGFSTKIFPVISEFNYLIVQATINNTSYLLDATDKYLSFGDIPFRCLNSYGRVLDFNKGSDWLDIEPSKPSLTQYKVELNLDDNQNITGNVYTKKTGYHCLSAKKSYFANKEIYVNNMHDKYPHLEITNHHVSNQDIKSTDFTETYDVEFENEATADNVYLNPFLTKFFSENPFKLQERTYPIDFGFKDAYYYTFKLNFGDNYTIIEKPKETALSLPNGRGQILMSSTVIGNSIMITLKMDFKDALYPVEYYPYLKEFLNKIVDLQTNSLILLKKVS